MKLVFPNVLYNNIHDESKHNFNIFCNVIRNKENRNTSVLLENVQFILLYEKQIELKATR